MTRKTYKESLLFFFAVYVFGTLTDNVGLLKFTADLFVAWCILVIAVNVTLIALMLTEKRP